MSGCGCYRQAESPVVFETTEAADGGRVESDNGKTWSDDIVLRDDGGSRDIGYPRAVQRPDGKVVAVYYFNRKGADPERYIAATIWTPPARDLSASK